MHIKVLGVHDPLTGKDFLPDMDLLQGITFYVSDPEKTRVFLHKEEVKNLKKNPPDHTGRRSIMFPLKQLI